jgi:phosphopantothenate-cysteine ligase
MKTVLITSGGAVENIDNVRGISNFATGRLGTLIAYRFVGNYRVIYVCGNNAIAPSRDVEIVRFSSAENLGAICREICAREKVDVIIQAAAVSDFCVDYVTNANGEILKDSKISSKHDKLIVHLKRAPKILPMFKKMSPSSLVVGFKLLSGGSNEELVSAAQELLKESNCEFVVANCLDNINGDNHAACLVNKAGVVAKYSTKQEIAKGVYKNVEEYFAGN